jgi:target of rapamycin complex subunit LST8
VFIVHICNVHIFHSFIHAQWQLEGSFKAHEDYLLKCLISPDMATLATTSADHSIKLWKLRQGGVSGSNPGPDEGGVPMTQHGGGDKDKDKDKDMPLVKSLTHHQRWVWDAVFSADSSYMVSASSDQSAKLWDLRSGDVIRNYLGHNLAVTCVALNDSNFE